MRIKKYACHRIYKGSKSFLAQSVVSVASDGKVVACTPLSEEIASAVAQLVSDEMQSVANLSVPLLAEAKIGNSWYEAK